MVNGVLIDSQTCTIVGDGTTDNSGCLSQVLTSASCAQYCAIQFGKGTYVFKSALSYTFPTPADSALSISGQGVGQTMLQFVGVDGFDLTYSAAYNDSVHFSNVTLLQTDTDKNTAISLDGCSSGTGATQNSPTTFDNVAISDAAGGSWKTGVSICAISFVNFNGFDFEAPASVGTGISFMGQASQGSGNANYAIQEQIMNSFFHGGATGIFYGDYIQGVAVVNSEFSDGIANAVVVDAIGGSQLSLYDDVITTALDGIVFRSDFPEFFFSNNVQTVAAGYQGIWIDGRITGMIDDNDFTALGGTNNGDIAVHGLMPVSQVTITGNNLSGFETGIKFDSGTSGYTEYNNGTDTVVSDLGSNAESAPDPTQTVLPCETAGMVCVGNQLVASGDVVNTLVPLPTMAVLPSTVLLADENGCVTGTSTGTANDACMATMLNACTSTCVIEFGAGVYDFHSAIAFTFPDDTAGSLSIYGQGQGATVLTFLENTDGLNVTYSSSQSDQFSLEDLTLVQQQADFGTGVHLQQSATVAKSSANIQNVTLMIGTGWHTGIWDDGVSNTSYVGVEMNGVKQMQNGTGIFLDGSNVPISQVDIINGVYLAGNLSLKYGENVSTVTVTNNEFTNSATAIDVTGSNALGLNIANTQFGNTNILIAGKLKNFQFDNDLVIVGTKNSPVGTGMTIMAPVFGYIYANDFGGQGNKTGPIGISAIGSTGSGLYLEADRLGGFNTAVSLDANSSGFNVYDNFFYAAGHKPQHDGIDVLVNVGTGNNVSEDDPPPYK